MRPGGLECWDLRYDDVLCSAVQYCTFPVLERLPMMVSEMRNDRNGQMLDF